MRPAVEAFAVVATWIMMLLPRWKASSVIVPSAGLPAAVANLGRLDAMVGCVADDVDQRIAQLVDQTLVEFGFSPWVTRRICRRSCA